MKPVRFFDAEPMRAEVKQNEYGNKLQGVGSEAGERYPEVDAECGDDEENSVEQKASGHDYRLLQLEGGVQVVMGE